MTFNSFLDNIQDLNRLIERYDGSDVMSGCIEERLNKSFESYFAELDTSYDNASRLNNRKLINKIKRVV